MRWAQSPDRLAISELLTGLSQAEDVLQDLDRYCEMGRDLVRPLDSNFTYL